MNDNAGDVWRGNQLGLDQTIRVPPTQAFSQESPARRTGSAEIFAGWVEAFVKVNWRPLTIVVISGTLTALYIIGRPYILYNDSDPLTYFRKAWWLIGRDGGTDVPSRGPGYPIWLIVTGAASFDTWWVLMASQVAMAIAAPVLVYGILAPISRNAGFVAGLLFMGFGISYTYMNWIMTEELFLFVELVGLVLISRYFCSPARLRPECPPDAGRWRRGRHRLMQWLATPYPIVLALAYATMVKPAAGPFFWIFLLVCLVFRVEPWRRYIGPAALYVAIIGGWGVYDYYYSPVRFPQLAGPTSEAQRYFADAYYGTGYGAVQDNGPTIRAEDGPASQRLYRAVSDHVTSVRANNQWNSTDPVTVDRLYGRFASDDALVREMFTRPNPLYFILLTQAAATDGADMLLYQVAREHGTAGAGGLAKHLAKHPLIPLMGPPNPYVGFMYFMKYYRYEHFVVTGQFGMRDRFSSFRGSLVREDNGPASKAFADSLRLFVDTYPRLVGLGPDDLAYFKTRENLTKFVIENPFDPRYSGAVMGWVYQWLVLMYGEEGAGRLMAKAAVETTLKNQTWGMLFGDFLAAAAYPGSPLWGSVGLYGLITDFRSIFDGIRQTAYALLVATVQGGQTLLLPATMANHVGHVGGQTELAKDMNGLLTLQYGVYKGAKPFMFASMLIFALPLIVIGNGGRLVAFLTLAFFASAAAWVVVMIMPWGDPRHEEVFAFFPLLSSVLGFASLPRFVGAVGGRAAGPAT
jgi:hypothetical protein